VLFIIAPVWSYIQNSTFVICTSFLLYLLLKVFFIYINHLRFVAYFMVLSVCIASNGRMTGK
jgi:hypothetical protein